MSRLPVSRRGISLLESIAAAALLSLLAAAAAPLIRDAARAIAPADPEAMDLVALSLLADRMLQDPSAFGIAALVRGEPVSAIAAASPETAGRHGVIVSRIELPSRLPEAAFAARPAAVNRRQGWLVLQSGENLVFRWIRWTDPRSPMEGTP